MLFAILLNISENTRAHNLIKLHYNIGTIIIEMQHNLLCGIIYTFLDDFVGRFKEILLRPHRGSKLLRGFKKLNLIPFKNFDPKERRWGLFCDSFEK